MTSEPDPTVQELLQQDWRDDVVLEELHQNRGWAATDIARQFDADVDEVLYELKERGIYLDGVHAAKRGFAARVSETDSEDLGGDSF